LIDALISHFLGQAILSKSEHGYDRLKLRIKIINTVFGGKTL